MKAEKSIPGPDLQRGKETMAIDEYRRKTFLGAKDIETLCGVGSSKAYGIINELNAELKAKGYLTLRGKVSSVYFFEKFYGGLQNGEQVD